jgi:hypothetical protein
MLDHPSRHTNDINLTVPAPGIAPMFHALNPMAAYMEFWKNSAYQVGGDVAQSWFHFLGERWLRDLKFPQQIAQCRTAGDVGVAVSEFWQRAFQDYSSEFEEIADLTWKAVRAPLNTVSHCASGDDEKRRGKCSS